MTVDRSPRSDEHEAVRVVGRTAARRMRRRHDPLAATSGHRDGRPARLAARDAVARAPAATDLAAAAHHQRLTLDAQPGAGHQQLGPLAERSPAARPATLRQSKLGAVAVRSTNVAHATTEHRISITERNTIV